MKASTSDDREHSALARAVALIALVFVVLGFLWYGFSSDVLQRQWQDLTGRPGGPMSFRFVLQPAMAVIAAVSPLLLRTEWNARFRSCLPPSGRCGC